MSTLLPTYDATPRYRWHGARPRYPIRSFLPLRFLADELGILYNVDTPFAHDGAHHSNDLRSVGSQLRIQRLMLRGRFGTRRLILADQHIDFSVLGLQTDG